MLLIKQFIQFYKRAKENTNHRIKVLKKLYSTALHSPAFKILTWLFKLIFWWPFKITFYLYYYMFWWPIKKVFGSKVAVPVNTGKTLYSDGKYYSRSNAVNAASRVGELNKIRKKTSIRKSMMINKDYLKNTMSSTEKTKIMVIASEMMKNPLPTPDVDKSNELARPNDWSGTHYNADYQKLEWFCDFISDHGTTSVKQVGDKAEFGDGGVIITYVSEDKSTGTYPSEDGSTEIEYAIRKRVYLLDFQCDVSLVVYGYVEGEIEEVDPPESAQHEFNFYNLATGSRDPSNNDRYFDEMYEDVQE